MHRLEPGASRDSQVVDLILQMAPTMLQSMTQGQFGLVRQVLMAFENQNPTK